ncbi:MAG: hypothetical protein J6S94_05840, partial [Bacteroidaceae bacterium]|nr:hypothetical protein [Bacteroidaceae bacterium]
EIHNTDEYPAFKAAIANNGASTPTGCSAWFLASGYQWKQMANAVGGYNKLGLNSGNYWSSSEGSEPNAWKFFSTNGVWDNMDKDDNYRVRSCLAF